MQSQWNHDTIRYDTGDNSRSNSSSKATEKRKRNEKKKNARIITAAAIIMLWYHGLYSPSYLNAKNIKTFNGSKPRIYNTNRHTKRKSGNQKVSLAVSHRIASHLISSHRITSHRIASHWNHAFLTLRYFTFIFYALNSIHLLFDSNRQEWQQTIIIQSSIETCFFYFIHFNEVREKNEDESKRTTLLCGLRDMFMFIVFSVLQRFGGTERERDGDETKERNKSASLESKNTMLGDVSTHFFSSFFQTVAHNECRHFVVFLSLNEWIIRGGGRCYQQIFHFSTLPWICVRQLLEDLGSWCCCGGGCGRGCCCCRCYRSMKMSEWKSQRKQRKAAKQSKK